MLTCLAGCLASLRAFTTNNKNKALARDAEGHVLEPHQWLLLEAAVPERTSWTLKPCYLKCSPHSSSITPPESLPKCTPAHSTPKTQNLPFSQIHECLVCPLEIESTAGRTGRRAMVVDVYVGVKRLEKWACEC